MAASLHDQNIGQQRLKFNNKATIELMRELRICRGTLGCRRVWWLGEQDEGVDSGAKRLNK